MYYRPELEKCPKCGGKLKRSHTRWQKTIQFLGGASQIYSQAYRCADDACHETNPEVYSSVYADGLSLPYRTYGFDVIVYIGYQRQHEHRTIPELHQTLVKEYGVQISEREVLYLFDEYLVLSACSHGKRLAKYQDEIAANGGIVLGIDGAKPEKGQPGLYIFRDALSGCRLHCALLPSADQASLSRELEVVKGLGLTVQAIISDDERATVAAVAETFPNVPHGLCHLHFLKAVQKPVYAQDQQLAKELKRPLRQLSQVERAVTQQPEQTAMLSNDQQEALRRYLDAMRAVLLTKGQAPFRLAGLTIYESLTHLADSLARALATHDHVLLEQLRTMADAHTSQHESYAQVLAQQAWFLGLADLLNVARTEHFGWSTLTGAEVAQAVDEYLEELARLQDELPLDAPFFAHMRRRLLQWAPGLFWTFEIDALPHTNNALEADIGDIKEQYRRITGRRSLKDYLMRYGPYLAFDDDNDDPEELLLWFQSVDRELYLAEKQKLQALRERLRNMQRFRSQPDAFLAETERLWDSPD